ncbi:MAG: type II secretion system protein [Campylobacterales bacterium]|nr:type II secretion system protein [Campylobacterales bacterium]
MKKGFTLLELIFVIVLLGVLASVGGSFFKPNYIIDDANFIISKIKETQFEAIGFDKQTFDGGEISSSVGCITLLKNVLKDDNYNIKSDFGGVLSAEIVCFDAKGSPNFDTKKSLILTHSTDSKTIIIEPKSGYCYLEH